MSTETLIKDLNQVVMEESEFKHSTRSKLTILYIYQKFGGKIGKPLYNDQKIRKSPKKYWGLSQKLSAGSSKLHSTI